MIVENTTWKLRAPIAEFVSSVKHSEDNSKAYAEAFFHSISFSDVNLKKSNPDKDTVSSQSEQLVYLLSTEQFEPGELSKADYFLEDIFEKYGEEHSVDVLNESTLKCQGSPDLHRYMHFLNVIKNALDFIDYEKIKLIPFVAIAYNNIYVKEAAIGIFEGVEFSEQSRLQDVINALKHSDTSQAKWINIYKDKVIKELESIRL